MAWNRKVPFKGVDMIRYVESPYRPRTFDQETGEWGYGEQVDPGEKFEWIDADEEFDATFEIMDYHRGRSAAWFVFIRQDTGGEYHISMGEIVGLMRRMNKGVVSGRWKFAKQGKNYALIPVEE